MEGSQTRKMPEESSSKTQSIKAQGAKAQSPKRLRKAG
jgi:hypothetical protein